MPRGQYDRQRATEVRAEPEADMPHESPRATETRRERRRRDDGDVDGMARMKLAIPRDVQDRADREGKTLRWMLDTPNRVQQAIADDWDRVEGVPPVAASRSEEGQMILFEKYRDWYDGDQARKMSRVDAMEQSMMATRTESDPSGTYTPKGVENRVTRQPGV